MKHMSDWFRFYTEALDDPKVQRLPGATFKGWVNILCLAKRRDGEIPSIKDVAFALRMSERKATELVNDLIAVGLLDECENGAKPHNWDGRQYKSDVSTERVQRYRKRQRNVSSTVSETPPEQKQSQKQNREPPKSPKGEYPAEFENQIWEPLAGIHDEQPKAGSKRKAFEAWQKACKRAPAKRIAEGARMCAERYAQPLAKDEFRPHPKMVVTWLNGDCWELEERAQPPPALTDAARARIAQLEAEDERTNHHHHSPRNQGSDRGQVADVLDQAGPGDDEGKDPEVGSAVRGLGRALRA